jgi:hypothetical protein
MNMRQAMTVHTPLRAQRGAASLVVTLILLFGMTLIAFYANRSFIFEQRTSANQYRATKAFEMADAGIEWALGAINSGLPVNASCQPAAAGTPSFRARYINPTAADATHPTGWLNVNTAAFPGCHLNPAGVSTCSCPAAGPAFLAGSVPDDRPRFGVAFRAVGGDPVAVEIISRGCTNTDSCDPLAADAATSDATAVVRVLVRVAPAIPAGPAAALTTGAAAALGGSLTVVNTHAPSNGVTIHSGTAVNQGSGTIAVTLPGTPPRSSILDNDPTLHNLTLASEDAFFSAFFGSTLSHYRNDDPSVIRINCSSLQAAACGSLVVAQIATGVERPRFYIDGDVSFNFGNVPSKVLGSATSPVTIVTSGNLEFKSDLTVYGLVYAATATAIDTWDATGLGGGTVFGAFISRGSFEKSGGGNLSLVYDPSLWGGTAPPNGRLVRVPGSWRDRATDY